jgi:pimeloyl-ACP methyl ester carboxylesterase
MAKVELIEIDGLRLAYRSAGRGEPLLLLHGFTYSSYSFRYNIPVLSKFFNVICPDLPGHGLSAKPASFDYSLANEAALIQRFCNELGLKKVVLGGCSMGGALAMRIAIDYPWLVDRLILVDSAGLDLDVKSPQRIFAIPIIGHVAALVTTARFRAGTKARMNSDEDAASREDYAPYMKELSSFSFLIAGMRNLRANRAFKVREIERIEQQTLIVWGERDQLFSIDSARMLAKIIPDSRLILLPEAGHLPNEEKPADFNQVVLDFLQRRIPSASGRGGKQT